jgi:hypothetical protein
MYICYCPLRDLNWNKNIDIDIDIDIQEGRVRLERVTLVSNCSRSRSIITYNLYQIGACVNLLTLVLLPGERLQPNKNGRY